MNTTPQIPADRLGEFATARRPLAQRFRHVTRLGGARIRFLSAALRVVLMSALGAALGAAPANPPQGPEALGSNHLIACSPNERAVMEDKKEQGSNADSKNDELQNAGASVSFRAVIERTLSLGTEGSTPFLRLKSSELVAQPAKLDAGNEATVLDWMKGNNIEVGLVEARGDLQLLCADFPAVYKLEPKVAERYWNQLSAGEFLAIYAHAGFAVLPFESTLMVPLSGEKTPITVYFPTRGLLRVTEVKPGRPAVVKIQFKLVANEQPPAE